MKKTSVFSAILCAVLALAVMGAAVCGVNGFTAPIVAENERLAAEAAAAAEKALLGDSVMLFDREKPEESTLTVAADTVQSVYQDNGKQIYIVRLSTTEGYTGEPIELTLTVDFEGRIVSLTLDQSAETRELSEDFLPSFVGQDSTLAGVQLVAGVTFSSSAIRNAVNDGFNALIDNGLFAAAEKDDSQLLNELIPLVYPGLVNKAGAVQGEEIEPDGAVTGGFKALNGSGFALFMNDGAKNYLAVASTVGGVTLYQADGELAANEALAAEAAAYAEAHADDLSAKQTKALGRLLPEGAELVPVEIPGTCGCVTGAYTAETEEGTIYAFAARPYGYSNEIMELYYVLDENGAIVSFRATELILFKEYFSDYVLDETAYKEGFIGLSGESFTGEQALISGATMSTDAVTTATADVFGAFGLLTESRG